MKMKIVIKLATVRWGGNYCACRLRKYMAQLSCGYRNQDGRQESHHIDSIRGHPARIKGWILRRAAV